jgi:hypothetical protein
MGYGKPFSKLVFLRISPIIASRGDSSFGRYLNPVFLFIKYWRFCSFSTGKISHLRRNASECVKTSILLGLACLVDEILFRILTRPAK